MFVQRWYYPAFIALTVLALGVFMLSAPMKVTAQSEPLCGQYIRHETEQAGFGSWISLFFVTEKGPMGISEPPFEEGYYRLYDVVTVSWT
ncbi:MAG: hypothetical protein NT121_03465, partial [Chloroflexi bacterium]|nr:hypothetical protein [Chloroflexota bacterium]